MNTQTQTYSLRILTFLAAGLLTCALSSRAGTPSIWNATNNIYNDTNWSTATNWVGGSTPISTSDVKFFDLGATNPAVINNVVDTSFTVTSLQYGSTNGNDTTLILPGQTLTVNGSFTNGTETGVDILRTNTITGPGGSLIINGNGSSTMIVRQGPASTTSAANRTTLDMSGLDNFTATVGRVLVGVGTGTGVANRSTGKLILARTNVVNVTSSTAPAFDVGESGSNNGNGDAVVLGQTNVISVDSLTVGRAKETGVTFSFNSAFSTPVAFIRGTNGVNSRVNTWAIGDGGSGGGTVPPRGTCDFTLGTLDARVNTLNVGRSTTATASINQTASGTLLINNGTLDVNSFVIGFNTAANTNWGNGTVTLNGPVTVLVNTNLNLGQTTGLANQGGDNTKGTLTINGGAAVYANTLNANFASTNNVINITNSTLFVTNGVTAGVNNLAINGANVGLSAQITATPAMFVTNLSLLGPTNTISILSVPNLTGYPATFPMIKYSGAFAGTFNVGLGSLPPLNPPTNYVGFISNNVANHSIDLVLTSGPAPSKILTWRGNNGSDWDLNSTPNWLNNGSPSTFNQGDFVTFDDTAVTGNVNMDTTVGPDGITVSNNTLPYVFTGFGMNGSAQLIKTGTGTMIMDNFSQNTFTGGIAISNGTFQVGNNDGSGNVPATGAILNNATFALESGATLAVSNAISGTGQIVVDQNSTLALFGNNSFSGAITVNPGSILQPANNNALGSTNTGTTVANGATLDFGGAAAALTMAPEPVTASGNGAAGASYSGAIINSGTVAQQNALRNLTLAGDTTFGGQGRWDIRGSNIHDPSTASLSTSGNAYNITKTGGNQVSITGVTVDPALNNVDIQQGLLSVEEATTGLGSSAGTVTVEQGATLQLFALTNLLNKNIILIGNGTATNLNNASGSCTNIGPIAINGSSGSAVINVGGTSLTLSGTLSDSLSGAGSVIKTGTNTLIYAGTANYTGGTTVSAGTLAANGTVGGAVSVQSGAVLSGTGTLTGAVDSSGTVNPGSIGGVGTLTSSGSLTLENFSSLQFDFANGSNDFLSANTLSLNGVGVAVMVNLLQPQIRLPNGTYHLASYNGSIGGNGASGFSGSVICTPSSRYTFTLNTATPGQINLNVSGNPSNLKWTSTGDTNWDIVTSFNWLDQAGSTSAQFYQGDTVLLDDSTPGVQTTLFIGTNVTVLPSAITNNSSANNYTISGGGHIGGTNSIVKLGTSTLTLATTNTFTGPVSVQAGVLRLGVTNALGTTNGTLTIASGATLDLNNFAVAGEPTIVGGAGVGGNGAIVNNSTNTAGQLMAFQQITLTADTTFGGSNRWDLRASGSTGGPPTASLSVGGSGYNITKVGTNFVGIVSATVDPTLGNVDIQNGILDFEGSTTSLGDPTKTITVRSNATLFLFNATNHLNKLIALNGGGTINNNNGTNFIAGAITVTGTNCTINAGGSSLTLSGAVGGSGTLIKTGTSNLVLTAANTYSGSTLVTAGTLSLSGSGAISSSPLIVISSGATLDASGRTDGTLTLAANQTLYGNGTNKGTLVVNANAAVSPGAGTNTVGTLNVTGGVTLLGRIQVEIDKVNHTNDLLRSTTGAINYGGTLVVTNISATPFAAGDSFKLFSAASYNGTFVIQPASPGAGLVWDASQLTSSGTLKVASSTPPQVGSIIVNGTSLSITGSNGQANSSYHILMSTNIAVPRSNWTPIASGNFDSSGNVSFSGSVATNSQAFYLIATP